MRVRSANRGGQKSVSRILLLALVVFTSTASTFAGTVRGRIDRFYYGRTYPAANVGVTLYNPQMGRSTLAYTGGDGMYYLYNVPPGNYYLEVWAYPGRDAIRYSIVVYNQPLTDIPPVVIQ